MTFTASTEAEAYRKAAELRRIHKGTDWIVTVIRPLFAGDRYLVVIG